MTLGPDQYRELLQAALPVADDADTIEPELGTLFTPAGHRVALDPDVTVVRGGRGVGKTVWFRALQNPDLRVMAADEYQLDRLRHIETLPGYGLLRTNQHPSQLVLERLVENHRPVDIWMAVVLVALHVPGIVDQPSWESRVAWLRRHPEDAEAGLLNADRAAHDQGTTKLFLFDALDRLHPERHLCNRLASGILQLALDLRTTTRNLRAKVFIRHDMLGDAQLSFPDASKVTANAVDLTWPETSLYGLLFHQLGNAPHPFAGDFRSMTGRWENRPERHVPPRDLVGDPDRQRHVFTGIAGPYMGTDFRKGHTYTWLPNHLADGVGQVSPRSFLAALRTATENTKARHSSNQTALHPDPIRQGVQAASRIRVREVSEDIPWVRTVVEPLGGLQVPIEQADVVQRWEERDLRQALDRLSSARPTSEEQAIPTGPLYGTYEDLIKELLELGVMSRRANGKLDLPDVYRIAFDLGRKGGVPRVRR